MRVLRIAAMGLALLGAATIGYAFAQSTTALPSDVYADSRNRLPLIKRDAMDELGKKMFDETAGDSRSLVGLQGPGGIRLYSPRLDQVQRPVNQFLRFNAGLDPKLVEVAILTVAREEDQRFEWYAHETNGLKVGVDPAVIDVIRNRKPIPAGTDAKQAALIRIGRGALGTAHRVDSATFADALKLFGPEVLINYVELMGNYADTSILLTTFNQQLPPGQVSQLPVK